MSRSGLYSGGNIGASAVFASSAELQLQDRNKGAAFLVGDAEARFIKTVTFATLTTSATFPDGAGIAAGTNTGLRIGLGATQKLGFFGAAPVTRRVLPAAGVVTADNLRQALIDLGLAA